MSNDTYTQLIGEPYTIPMTKAITFEPRKRRSASSKGGGGRIIPENSKLKEWLDSQTPGWRIWRDGNSPTIRYNISFETVNQAVLYKTFWL